MTKSFFAKAVLAVGSVALTAGTLLAPITAHASHGIKCGWVLVSSVKGNNTYTFVCGVKGP